MGYVAIRSSNNTVKRKSIYMHVNELLIDQQNGDLMQKHNLPEYCYAVHPLTKRAILIERGGGYRAVALEYPVQVANCLLGISRSQAQAMIGGILYGWDSPLADPDNYDVHGFPLSIPGGEVRH